MSFSPGDSDINSESLKIQTHKDRQIQVKAELNLKSENKNSGNVILGANVQPNNNNNNAPNAAKPNNIPANSNATPFEPPGAGTLLKDIDPGCCSSCSDVTARSLCVEMFTRNANSCGEYCRKSILGFILMIILWAVAIGLIFIGIDDKS